MSKHLFAKEYEDFLITGKEDSINSLPSGSVEKEYFILTRQLLKEDLTPELEKKIEENVLNRITREQGSRLRALEIFKKLKKKKRSFKKLKIYLILEESRTIPNLSNIIRQKKRIWKLKKMKNKNYHMN